MLFPDSCYWIHDLKSCDFITQASTDPTLSLTVSKGFFFLSAYSGRWWKVGSGSGCIQPLQLFHWRNCMSVKSWGAMDWRHCIPWEQNFLKNALFVSVKVRESSWVRNFIWILAQSLMEICQSKLPSMTIQHPYRHKQSPVYLFLAFPIFFLFFFYTQHVTHPHFPLWHTGKPLVFYCSRCSVAPSSAFWNNLASTDPSSPTVRPFLRWDCGEVLLEDDYGATLLSDTLLWKHAARELL